MPTVRGGLYLFGARFFNAGSQLILVIVVSRALGPEEFGLYSFLSALILIGYSIGNFGLDTYMVREISRGEISIKNSLGNFIFLKAGMSFIAIFSFAIFLTFYPLSSQSLYLFWLYSLSIIFRVPAETLWYAGDGLEKFGVHSVLWSINNFLKLVFGALAVLEGGGIEKLIIGLVAADAFAFVVSWFIFFKTIGSFNLNINLKSAVSILGNVPYIALGGFLGTFYFRLDTLMLEIMKNNSVVGFYSAAYKVFEIFSIFPGTMLLVFFPLLSKSHCKGQEIFQKHFFQGIYILGISGFFAGCLLYYFSPWIIYNMYGASYESSIAVLRILAWAIVFYFINFYFGFTLISMGRERQNLFFLLLSTFFNFILNMAMIPSMAHIGAAWSTILSEIFLLALYIYHYLRKFVFSAQKFRDSDR